MSFYQTRTHVNDTFTVQLEEFEEGHGWTPIDDIKYPSTGNTVRTPEGFSNDTLGAKAHAAQVFKVEDDNA
jgi:hypothetical protein